MKSYKRISIDFNEDQTKHIIGIAEKKFEGRFGQAVRDIINMSIQIDEHPKHINVSKKEF